LAFPGGEHSGEKRATCVDKDFHYLEISPPTNKMFHTENSSWGNFSVFLLRKVLPEDPTRFTRIIPGRVLPRDLEIRSIRKLANRTGFSTLKSEFLKS
jgi:hypothetical protein